MTEEAAVDFARRLDVVGRHGDFFATVREPDLGLEVSGCPGWSVGDLCLHVGGVLHFWAALAEGAPDPGRVAPPEPPASIAAVGPWCAQRARACTAALGAVGPEAPMWTFWGAGHGGDVARRIAHEMTVHALDLAAALGRVARVEPDEAEDAIGEFCDTVLAHRREGHPGPGGSVHLHCTDIAAPGRGEWMIREAPDATLEVTREHAKGTCALRGEAVTLLLVLWRRLPVASADVFGNAEVAERLVAGTELS